MTAFEVGLRASAWQQQPEVNAVVKIPFDNFVQHVFNKRSMYYQLAVKGKNAS